MAYLPLHLDDVMLLLDLLQDHGLLLHEGVRAIVERAVLEGQKFGVLALESGKDKFESLSLRVYLVQCDQIWRNFAILANFSVSATII